METNPGKANGMPILGLAEFRAAIEKVAAETDAAARLAVTKAAAYLEKEAKAGFEGVHGKGQPHVGGDKPNVVTGTARRSIRSDPVSRMGLGDYRTIVAPRAVYYRRLELGYPGGQGRGHQHTRAFPSFGPAAEKAREKFPEIAGDTWREFLTR
jgi:hypothetical protein